MPSASAALPRRVFVASDHTGITADSMARALLSHFPSEAAQFELRPFVDTPAKAEALLAEIATEATRAKSEPLLFSTVTPPEVRAVLDEAKVPHFDLLTDNVRRMEGVLGAQAVHHPGGLHDMTDAERYLGRMEALDFALATDDGLGERQYGQADVILVGVSRAGKTPTSLFLALQHGKRASNYPLADGDFERRDLPAPLQPHKHKLFALTIDPMRLHAIRTQRRASSDYASLEQCEHEVRRAEAMFRRFGLPVRDTTSASVEEIASGILAHLRKEELR